MSALASNVLMIGEFLPSASNLDVEVIPRIDDLLKKTHPLNYDVVVVPALIAMTEDFHNAVKNILSYNVGLQIILITPPTVQPEDTLQLISQFPVFRIVNSVRDLDFEQFVLESIEESQRLRQNAELEKLIQSQNLKLTQLSMELEDRVQKRQTFLEDAKRKAFGANAKWEAIMQVSISAYKAISIFELEQNLKNSLNGLVRFDSVRILTSSQETSIGQQQQHHQYTSFSIDLALPESLQVLGNLVFIRNDKKSFTREETDLLNKISEVVSLALNRLLKLNQSEALRDQWETTFNAVSDPVCLMSSQYEIIQANSAFLKKAQIQKTQLSQKKCYQLLFHRDSPCPHCQLGNRFRLEAGKNQSDLYEVFSQSISLNAQSDIIYVNQYHDITEQSRMQRKIIESARLAEIGTIGGSIAHELNNPLGGMLSFIQLIQMDLKQGDQLSPDLKEMEQGVRRCQEIVQNLLGFVRNPTVDEVSTFSLQAAIERAIRIIELQTKSMGIEIKIQFPNKQILFHGYLNVISHAFQNLLQNSIERIFDHIRLTGPYHGVIEIKLVESEKEIEISIVDNGPSRETHDGLGLSVARQIIHDLNGYLEINTQLKNICMAKISLPRPVFKAEGPNS